MGEDFIILCVIQRNNCLHGIYVVLPVISLEVIHSIRRMYTGYMQMITVQGMGICRFDSWVGVGEVVPRTNLP